MNTDNRLLIAGAGGRIFNCILRALANRGKLHCVVGVSASGPKDLRELAEKLDYDSTHGAFPLAVRHTLRVLKINDDHIGDLVFYEIPKDEYGLPIHDYDIEGEDNYVLDAVLRIPVFAQGDPSKLPLAELGVDVAIDATGKFLTREKASAFLEGGAKKVIMTAPAKDDTPSIIHGINDEVDTGLDIVSRASCTTTCAAPIVKALGDRYGFPTAVILNTTHAVTGSQKVVDGNTEKPPNGYAAMDNIVVTDTGATKSLQKIFPEIKSTYGISCRVPVSDGSILQLVMKFNAPEGEITREGVIKALKAFEREHPLNLRVSHRDNLVSTYLVGRHEGCIVTLDQIDVIDDLVIVVVGYDNEYGYSYLNAKSALDAPIPA
jgi:glyceraldehyde 3-phosphate dehydrogenase